MAANNYFGFTHGGTQYSAQAATAYPAAQTAYVQPAHPQSYATAAPRAAATYDTYQTTHPTGQYAYAARTQATATYDTTKTYYAPAAAPVAPTAVYTVAEPAYQAAKPTYTTTNYTAQTQPRQPASANTTPASSSYVTSYTASKPSSTYTSNPVTTTSSTYSAMKEWGQFQTGKKGYDAALYSAATTYYQQQQQQKTPGTTWRNKPVAGKPAQKKAPPKQPQLHYCEVCKISCAGPQTYREHLEGQKHKKKEAAAKTGTAAASTGRAGQNQLRCELCDVACTGADAYTAHLRGAKHQKVLKLHTKLGKPIPSTEPVVVANTTSTPSVANSASTAATTKAGGVKTTAVANTAGVKKVVSTPKITFVGGTQLKTTGNKAEEVKKTAAKPSADNELTKEDEEDKVLLPGETEVMPVGQEYIEEVKNEMGKTISFNCKLCECKFNDPNAKEMHMKGRRHRLQYKKKVDPSLQVEVKPSIRARKIQEEKLRRQAAKEEYWRRRDAEERWRAEMTYMMEEEHYWDERRRYEEEMEWMRRSGRGGVPRGFPNFPMRRQDTSDDRHVMAKHASIYPNEAELQAVQNIVSSCEKALKLVSDFIAESDAPKPMETDKKDAVKNAKDTKVVAKKEPVVKKEGEKKEVKKEEEPKEEEKKEEPQAPPRALKGVMRVGVLAKGLLLHGDLNVHLVLLCSEKPTRTLLERVVDCLPKQMATATEDKYDVKMCVEEAAVIVTAEKEPKTTCTITLTSPIMRDENNLEGESVTVKDPPDVLDGHKCLEALAALRHAKWFQARANGLQSCVVVIRILRDLCQRVPTWAPLNQWAMELLAEKCVSSGGSNMSPGDALRRVFECLASGILLPGGPGLYDPCEKDPTDAAASLSNQEREDITASAQHALRLIAFRQIHKVLGMDALPAPRFQRKPFNTRKRRRTNSTGDGLDGEGEAGKKDKKEDGDEMETSATEGSTQK